jgi:hypothetical protein
MKFPITRLGFHRARTQRFSERKAGSVPQNFIERYQFLKVPRQIYSMRDVKFADSIAATSGRIAHNAASSV